MIKTGMTAVTSHTAEPMRSIDDSRVTQSVSEAPGPRRGILNSTFDLFRTSPGDGWIQGRGGRFRSGAGGRIIPLSSVEPLAFSNAGLEVGSDR
jgi:hypothetical protein